MATLSFRLPDDLKRRMDEADIDWPARLRAFVEEELRRQQVHAALEDLRALRERHRKHAAKLSLSREVIRSRREDH